MAAGTLLRLVVLTIPARPAWDGVIYASIAEHLAAGRGYTLTAFSETFPNEASAFYPVGYPAFLSVLTQLGTPAELLAQALLGTLLIALTWLVARPIAGTRTARIAAWLVALWPGGVLLSASYLTEPLFAALLLLGVLPIAWARRQRARRAMLLSVLILAVGAYVRPTALVVIPFVVAAHVYSHRRRAPRAVQLREAASQLAFAAAVALLVLSPWMARNAVRMGAPVAVSTNGGANLLMGTFGSGGYSPIPDAVDCEGKMSELARDHCRRTHAVDRIADAPGAWLGRGLLKLSHTFGHESAPAHHWLDATRQREDEPAGLWALGLTRLFYLVLFCGAAIGAVALRQRRARRGFWVVMAPILAIATLHFITIGGDRYHIPLVPFFAILTGAGVAYFRGPRPASARAPYPAREAISARATPAEAPAAGSARPAS